MYYSSYFHPMSVEQESRQQAPPNPTFLPGLPGFPPQGGGTNARIDQLQREINRLNRRVNRIENILGIRDN